MPSIWRRYRRVTDGTHIHLCASAWDADDDLQGGGEERLLALDGLLDESREHLLRSIDDYETQKMLGMLEQLQIRSDEAEKSYQDALAVGASNAATLKEIVESFKRQQVVLQGQIVHHPAFTTLTEPSFQYRKAAPSRWKMPLVLTLILGICLLAWVNRKEIIRFL